MDVRGAPQLRPDPVAAAFVRRNARYAAGIVVLAVLYRGVAEIGYALNFAGPVAAIAWLPVGVGIAFLYMAGLRYWPGVVIGDLLANDYVALPLGSALGQTFGNVLEILVATMLLRRLVPGGNPLASVECVGRMLLAIGIGTTVSATVGPISLLLGDVIDGAALTRVWRTWWLGDATGALIVLPLALAWARPPTPDWWRRHALETALLLVLVAAISEVTLRYREPLLYLVFPPLIWAALRVGPRGATLAVAVAAGFAIWGTTRQVGPFAFESITHSILATQLYLAVAALSTLFLAAVVCEREAFAASLAASRSRLADAAAAERRRIEQDLHDGAQQRLNALLIRLRLGAEQVADAPETAVERLQSAEQELSGAIEELRELAHGIHPSALRERGLAQALAELASRSAVPVQLELTPTRLDATAELTAYFLVAEAITNARKHAHATSISVRATLSHGLLHIVIADDGQGGADESAGSGLQGLRDRVEAIGGSFALQSDAGGTAVLAMLPATPAPRDQAP